MSDDQQDQLREMHRGEGGGGPRQEIGRRYSEDPVFRKFMNWTWAFFGLAFMSMQVWLVSSVADIKTTIARGADKDTQIDSHLANTDRYVEKLDDREDRHYDYLKGKVDQYEGKTMRGGIDEKRRGN